MPDARTPTRTETLRLARPESILEARPKPEVPGAEEMFLSPRVLDAGAFARYAEVLKSLIADARQGARDLQDFSADADQMIAGCRKAGEQIRVRLEAGARVVRLIDERADRAEQILETVRRELPDEARVRELIEPAVRQAAEAARVRAAEIGEETERRARAAAADIERKIAAMSARAEAQAARLEQAGRQIEERLGSLESRLAGLIERADAKAAEFEARARDAADAANAALKPALERAAEAAASIDDALSRAWRQAEERAGRLTERMEPLQRACDSVLARLGLDPADPDPAGSVLHRLDGLVRRAEASLEGAERVANQMSALRSQAETAKSEFGSWLLEAAGQLDRLEARREELTGPLAEAADKVARVAPLLNDDLRLAVTTMDQLQIEQAALRQAVQASTVLARQASSDLNNQSAQLKALIDGSVHTLSRRVEEAAAWLGQLIVRAEEAGHKLGGQARPGPTDAPLPAPLAAPVQAAPERPANAPAAPNAIDLGGVHAPLPPALPIDAVSFDGSPVVFGHDDPAED